MRHKCWVLLGVLGVGGGCLVPDPEPVAVEEDEPAPGAVDESSLLSVLATYRTSPGFARLNLAPYVTALESRAYVNVWVSAHAFASYSGIVPESSGSGLQVPEGTLIVREVLGADGAPATLTLMYKGPEGYNPELGDWWFGVTDARGTPTKMGKLEECYSCHADRAEDDFLFGVPRARR